MTDTPDLEKERDVRVIPIAQGAIEDIAGITLTDVNDRSQFTNVIMSLLKRSLDADLNVTTDVPYIFQLALSAFSAFNTFILSCKMTDIPDARYSAIAHELMKLLVDANVPMGTDVKAEDQAKALEGMRASVEEIFAREMLTRLEVTYILEGLMNALKVTNQVFGDNVSQSVDRMESKILGLDAMSDLTMKQLDWALSTRIEDIKAKNDATVGGQS